MTWFSLAGFHLVFTRIPQGILLQIPNYPGAVILRIPVSSCGELSNCSDTIVLVTSTCFPSKLPTLQFFFSSSHYTEVDHILLAGGVAAIEGLSDLVQESLSTPVTVANPFLHLTISSKVNKAMLENDAPSLMIACGLAMRGEY